MRIVDCEQGSKEWLQARCGRITASRIADVMNFLKKGGEGADRRNYRMDLIAERLTGRTEEHYVSNEMIWGSEHEQFARTAYELQAGVMTDQVGFIIHPRLDYSGASPDSLVGDEGGLELKCPKTTTHLAWMMKGQVPEEHQPQMQWNMACAERLWWDFVSYDPRLPKKLQLFTVRLAREDSTIAEIEEQVIRMNNEVNSVIQSFGIKYVPTASELNSKTEKVGGLDVPEDILRMLDQEIAI